MMSIWRSKHVEAWNKLVVKQKILCIKLVNYWDKYTELHGQQNDRIYLMCGWTVHRYFNVDKKPTRCHFWVILYFSFTSCSTCFGQPCAHLQELTTALCYHTCWYFAVTMSGVIQICLSVSGLCVVMCGYVGCCGVVVFHLITHRTRPTYNNVITTHNTPHNHTQPTHRETYLNNTTHCYSTIPTRDNKRSRQLLKMGIWLPETC